MKGLLTSQESMNAYGEAVTGERGRREKKREERVRKGKGRERKAKTE